MRLGTEDSLTAALQGMGFSGRLNTAFIERVNLTIRHAIAALARRTWATAQQSPSLLAHLEWWRAYYHGCRVHTSRCEWPLQSLANEVASVWHNAIGNGCQPWQPEELIDDGRLGRCSLVRYHRFPLERCQCQIWVKCYVMGRLVKCQQKHSDRASLREKKAGLDCPMMKNQPEIRLKRLNELSTISDGST
jgi:hypothetical protein